MEHLLCPRCEASRLHRVKTGPRIPCDAKHRKKGSFCYAKAMVMIMKMKRNDEGTQSATLGIVIIVVVMVLLFGAAFVFMYSHDMLFLPDFIENIFGLDEKKEDTPWDVGALSEIVKSGADNEGEGIVFDVTYENILSALLSEENVDGLHLEADIFYYTDEEPIGHKIIFYKNGEMFRAEIFASDNEETAETIKTGDGENITLYDPNTNKKVTYKKADEIAAEDEAGIPSVYSMIEILNSFPKSESGENMGDVGSTTGDSQISDYSLKLVRHDDRNVYYIAFTDNLSELKEEYYVSLDYRVIIHATIKTLKDEPVYSYDVTEFSTDKESYSDESLYIIE